MYNDENGWNQFARSMFEYDNDTYIYNAHVI